MPIKPIVQGLKLSNADLRRRLENLAVKRQPATVTKLKPGESPTYHPSGILIPLNPAAIDLVLPNEEKGKSNLFTFDLPGPNTSVVVGSASEPYTDTFKDEGITAFEDLTLDEVEALLKFLMDESQIVGVGHNSIPWDDMSPSIGLY